MVRLECLYDFYFSEEFIYRYKVLDQRKKAVETDFSLLCKILSSFAYEHDFNKVYSSSLTFNSYRVVKSAPFITTGAINRDGSYYTSHASDYSVGIRPCFQPEYAKDESFLMGYYPKNVVDYWLNSTLKHKLIHKKIYKTGNRYSLMNSLCKYTFDEYEYDGNRYIYFDFSKYGKDEYYGDIHLSGSRVINYNDLYSLKYIFIKVEPVEWYFDKNAGLCFTKDIICSGVPFVKDIICCGVPFVKEFIGNLFQGSIDETLLYKFLNDKLSYEMFEQHKQNEIIPDILDKNQSATSNAINNNKLLDIFTKDIKLNKIFMKKKSVSKEEALREIEKLKKEQTYLSDVKENIEKLAKEEIEEKNKKTTIELLSEIESMLNDLNVLLSKNSDDYTSIFNDLEMSLVELTSKERLIDKYSQVDPLINRSDDEKKVDYIILKKDFKIYNEIKTLCDGSLKQFISKNIALLKSKKANIEDYLKNELNKLICYYDKILDNYKNRISSGEKIEDISGLIDEYDKLKEKYDFILSLDKLHSYINYIVKIIDNNQNIKYDKVYSNSSDSLKSKMNLNYIKEKLDFDVENILLIFRIVEQRISEFRDELNNLELAIENLEEKTDKSIEDKMMINDKKLYLYYLYASVDSKGITEVILDYFKCEFDMYIKLYNKFSDSLYEYGKYGLNISNITSSDDLINYINISDDNKVKSKK